MRLQVSAKSDYALRALLVLSAQSTSHPVKAEALARAQQIPVNYLWTILMQLRAAGIVSSLRGNEGGYWLSRTADDVTVADVVEAVEMPLVIRESASGRKPYAGDARHLGDVWRAAETALSDLLTSVTLADIRDGEGPCVRVSEIALDVPLLDERVILRNPDREDRLSSPEPRSPSGHAKPARVPHPQRHLG